MRQRRRRAGCVPHRPGRGRGAGAADGLSRGGGGAGRPPRPRRSGGVAPHLLRPAGEELFAIARRYHVSPGQMLAANDLPDGTARLDEARRLLVPGV